MAAMEVHAGVVWVTITPPIGSVMIGFVGRGRAHGFHDDLTATGSETEP